MKLIQLKKDKLIELANTVDVELENDDTKEEIVAKLESQGVTMDTYNKFVESNQSDSVEAEVEPVEKVLQAKTVLLKMDRKNPSLEVLGHRFTKQHPYAVVSEEKAQEIMDLYEGFRLASPREVEEFYG